MTVANFWETLSLDEMDAQQWESLCDGCGRCCAVKLQDAESGQVHYTRAACRLLDTDSCRCTDYANRAHLVPDCLVLDSNSVRNFAWLPDTCAYRLVAESKPLKWWHPLVSGSAQTVHEAGISVRGKLISENYIHASELQDLLLSASEGNEQD